MLGVGRHRPSCSYRRVTSSSSAVMMLAAGLPVIIPDLPSLADIPESCAWRYDGTITGLARALETASRTSIQVRLAMSSAARALVTDRSWDQAAAATLAIIREANGRH